MSCFMRGASQRWIKCSRVDVSQAVLDQPVWRAFVSHSDLGSEADGLQYSSKDDLVPDDYETDAEHKQTKNQNELLALKFSIVIPLVPQNIDFTSILMT